MLRSARRLSVLAAIALGGCSDAVAAMGEAPEDEPATSTESLFFDGFESGTKTSTNAEGFRWVRSNRTSVVTNTASVWNDNGQINNPKPPEKDWTAFSGEHSLRFRFPGGSNSYSEQRFDLGQAHREIWIRYSLRVPTNFTHRFTGGPNNSKFFAIWMDAYQAEGNGATVTWEFWPGADRSGGSEMAYNVAPGGRTASGGQLMHNPFIRVPEDRGRWMHVVLHVVAATSQTSNDGLIETFVRWDGESGFRQLHSDSRADIGPASTGPQGWKAGYVMGWSNPGYDEETEWLMDDFTVSTTNLLGN